METTKISKKKMQSIKTRATVLEAATKCFGDYGYEGCSLDVIARAAGITKGAIYTHFPSKAELFMAIIAYAYKRPMLMAASLKDRLPCVDGILAILGECARNRDYPIEHKLWAEILSVAQRDRAIGEVFLKCEAQLQLFIENWLREAAQKGELAADLDKRSIAEVLFVLGHGALARVQADEGAYFSLLEKIVRNLLGRP